MGDLMMGLLKEARAIHFQQADLLGVEANQAAHLNEDLVSQPVVELVHISHPDARNGPIGENVEAIPVEATPVGDAPGSPPEPVHARTQSRVRSRSRSSRS